MQNYFLGLDIGTDSVGYAAANESYDLLKRKGEPVWGVTLFEEASLNTERRAFRTARRRLDRRQQRIQLLQELFAEEIEKVDEFFFTRMKNSALWREDAGEPYCIFNDAEYTDKQYHAEYPTIHHLLVHLMKTDEPQDIRLVYLACAWLVAHRGHFLSDVSRENVAALMDFHAVHENLIAWFTQRDVKTPDGLDHEAVLERVLCENISVLRKYDHLKKELFNGEKPQKKQNDYLDTECFLKLLCGSKVALEKLFCNEGYADAGSVLLGADDEVLAALYASLSEDDAELLQCAKTVYDWALLVDILKGGECISAAKKRDYERHKADLKWLKDFVKKYAPAEYRGLFRDEKAKDNYAAYAVSNTAAEAFGKRLTKLLKSVTPEAADADAYNDALERIGRGRFLPKQVTTDNRVIPYQLYWHELDRILKNAEKHHLFLAKRDEQGLSVSDKIRSVFSFRVPYFVGPLNSNANNAWLQRKAEGKIYPWNLPDMVDLDASENEFIRRMTAKCTYLPAEDVLPKDSLLYHRFMVLNELNNLKINGMPISVELKQELYTELFLIRKKVTRKQLMDHLASRGYEKTDTVSGIDEQIHSDLRPQIEFAGLLERGVLTEEDAEIMILRLSISEDKRRFVRWLGQHYPALTEADAKYLSGLRYHDSGRLSKRFLSEIEGVCKETGEVLTIIQALWETNYNLMELLSDKFTFAEVIAEENQAYYAENPKTTAQRLDEMYISNAVKRPIIRTLDIVKEVTKAMGQPPQKIFIEMARGASVEQRNKRTESRYQQILKLYDACKHEDVPALRRQLEALGGNVNARLQSRKLFLYFMQLGRCMYTGEPIEFSELFTKQYDLDHIYPQAMVKDDSILHNLVLVKSEANGAKSDTYPVAASIRQARQGFWSMLKTNGLITEEKYKRLTRSQPFTADEKWGFINRQLTETTQSTKAVSVLLKELYPETEIVYVKARLGADFRQEFDRLKSRTFNDLHHAKDAYLNIVVGNVYHSKFTQQWFMQNHEQRYSIRTDKLFTKPVICGKVQVWDGESMLAKVKKIVASDHAHMTRYAFCRKGGLFDQQPVKKAEGLVPLKKGMPTEKYGGYNKPTVTFFMFVKYRVGKKQDLMLMPVQLVYSKGVLENEECAADYAKKRIGEIIGKTVNEVSFPLGLRKIKINTIFSLDGFRVCLAGSSSGGKVWLAQPFMPFHEDYQWNRYMKRLESVCEKLKEHPDYPVDKEQDGVDEETNLKLYDLYIDKLKHSIYCKRPNNPIQTLEKKRETFRKLSVAKQVQLLISIHPVFGRTPSGGCDMQAIEAGKNVGNSTLNANFSNLKKYYTDVRIIDTSAAGLYEHRSPNLLDFLEDT